MFRLTRSANVKRTRLEEKGRYGTNGTLREWATSIGPPPLESIQSMDIAVAWPRVSLRPDTMQESQDDIFRVC
jgi:hypothetical protein